MNKFVMLTFVCGSLVHIHEVSAVQLETEKNHSQLTEKFLKLQLDQNLTIVISIKSILSHYPHQSASLVFTAFYLYPDTY